MRGFGQSESKYVKSIDLAKTGGGFHSVELTISRVGVETLQRENEDDEKKYILYFEGREKGMVLNVTNEEFLTELYGNPPGDSPEELTSFFYGQRVVLYVDPNVKFAGKKVGGLRLAQPQARSAQAAPVQPPAEEPPPPGDDDIPF